MNRRFLDFNLRNLSRKSGGKGDEIDSGYSAQEKCVGLKPEKGWARRNCQFIGGSLIPTILRQRERSFISRPVYTDLKHHEIEVTWIGHASFLIRTPGLNIMIDPNWAMWHGPVKRARHPGMDLVDLPEIDLVLVTHAHFDHLGATGTVVSGCSVSPSVALHADDKWLWKAQGGAALFGIEGVDAGPEPDIDLVHGKKLSVGGYDFEVFHAPGHTPGHTMFYCKEAGLMFCGDVIFRNSIGRTDLPGGDYDTLISSIGRKLLSLPPETIVYPGHGPSSTIEDEIKENPFLSEIL